MNHTAPVTFQTKADAEAWLTGVQAGIHRAALLGETWQSPQAQQAQQAISALTFAEYTTDWLAGRDVAPRTRALYESLLRVHLLPAFGDMQLSAITRNDVTSWHAQLRTGPTAKANAYGLMRTIMGEAVDAELIPTSPVRVKGAGSKKRARELRVLTRGELQTIVDEVPDKYQALILLGGWCALRFGELAALRRRDLDLRHGLVHVRHAVSVVDGQTIVGPPKAGSVRAVHMPPDLVPVLREHLATFAAKGADGLIFPAADGKSHLALSTLHRVWKPAKVKAGRPDVRVHDLRHFGLVMAARAGATLGELQARAGHSTAQAALVYQSAASERHAEIAARMSAIAD